MTTHELELQMDGLPHTHASGDFMHSQSTQHLLPDGRLSQGHRQPSGVSVLYKLLLLGVAVTILVLCAVYLPRISSREEHHHGEHGESVPTVTPAAIDAIIPTGAPAAIDTSTNAPTTTTTSVVNTTNRPPESSEPPMEVNNTTNSTR